MKKLLLLNVTILLLLTSCKKDSPPAPTQNTVSTNYSYTQLLYGISGLGRKEAVAFVIGDTAYIGTGTNSSQLFADFYKFNTVTQQWGDVDYFLGYERRGAVAFTLNGFGYVGMGYGYNGTYTGFNDWYRYDPSTGNWSSLNNFGGNEGYTCFVVNNAAYLMDLNRHVYVYDPAADTWIARNNFPGTINRSDAVAFTIGNKAYYGTGYNRGGSLSSARLKDFWEYDPMADSWTQKADLPGNGIANAIGFSVDGFGFIGTGSDYTSSYREMYHYDPATNQWTSTTSFYGAASTGLICFVVNNVAYMGTGYSTTYSSDIYKFDN